MPNLAKFICDLCFAFTAQPYHDNMYKVICYLCIIARHDNTDVLLGLACSKGTVSRDQQPLFTIFAMCVTLDRSLEYIV